MAGTTPTLDASPQGGRETTATPRSNDRSSWAALTPTCSFSCPPRWISWSSVRHPSFINSRMHSDPCQKSAPAYPPGNRGGVNSLHRCTKCEIMTSDWCSEAGWFGRRFEPGQAGEVGRAQVTRRLNLLPWRGSCSASPKGFDWRSVKNAVWSEQEPCGGGALRKRPGHSRVNAQNPGHDGGAKLRSR